MAAGTGPGTTAGWHGSAADRRGLTDLVERYFAAVDRMDLAETLACFTEDARVTIATFDAVYHGRDAEVRGMYERLFARYASVWHGDFDHVAQAPDRIASQFTVRNVSLQGGLTVKHNCNFFRLRNGLVCDMSVYMSGDNSLR
ncbi:MAG: nuclear transport factor 2 family protein [Rhodoferax sp.]|nr:nuclear transport factor 2 family protein [Rhodoferax sp.]